MSNRALSSSGISNAIAPERSTPVRAGATVGRAPPSRQADVARFTMRG
jgi:hypothetical protein